ncbi:DUF3606 domain-containing protein [Microvirga sp. HBU67558]|nr:DUF3606 domain-containing protein [Microvirga sp. HBU67558]
MLPQCGLELLESGQTAYSSKAGSNRGGADRGWGAGGEGYEVEYFARKHGISVVQAEELIKEHGNNREKLDAAAGKLKRG